MQVDNQNTVEMLIKTKMDISQFERNLGTLERKLSVVQKELDASISKIGQSANKSSMAYDKATNARIVADKQAIQSNQRRLDQYKIEQAYLERQIVLAKQLSTSKTSGFKWSTQAPDTMSPKVVGVSLKPQIAQHEELDRVMRRVNETAKGSFPHKVATTSQYMLAGAGIMGVVNTLSNMTSAIVEADKAFHMFQGVLEMTKEQAAGLQQEIFKIGTTFGGNLQDLNESALALGRAGLQSNQLAGALKVVSQAALLSGDSLDAVTELFVSWKTVHPEETIGNLGDMMTKVANDSLASFDDFKVMSNYLLTSTQTMGLTAKATIALGGAWRNLGKGASTTGTEIRRFMDQISNGSDEVNKAYADMGVNLNKVQKGLAQGGAVAEATMKQLYRSLAEHPEKAAIAGAKLQTLDKATFNSNIALAKRVQLTSGEWVTAYEKMVDSAEKSSGALQESTNKVVLSYSVMWERIKNSMSSGSDAFANAFKDGFVGANETVGDFNARIAEFDRQFSSAMKSTGESIGFFTSVIADALPYLIRVGEVFAVYKTALWATTSASVATTAATVTQTGVTVAATEAQIALNTAVRANPFVFVATAIGTAIAALGLWLSKVEEANSKIAVADGTKSGNRDFTYEATSLDKLKTTQEKYNEALKQQGLAYSRHTKSVLSFNEHNSLSATSIMEKDRQSYKLWVAKVAELKSAARLEKDIAATKSAGKIDLSGAPAPKDKPISKSAIESTNKNLLDEELQRIRLKEQQYFYDNKITSELEQQKYHVSTTLKEELKATESAGFYKNKLEDTLKVKINIWKTSSAITEADYQSNIEASRRLEDIQAEYKAIGYLSEEKLVELNYNKQLVAIEREALDLAHKKGSLSDEDILYLTTKIKLTDEQTQKLREQAVINSRLRDESIAMTSLQIKTANATTGADQIALEQESLRLQFAHKKQAILDNYIKLGKAGSKQQENEIKNAELLLELELRKVQGAESYVDLLDKSNVAYERNNSTAQKFMRITEAGLQALDSGLMNFFDTGSEGFGKWSVLRDNLAQAIMKGLLQELVVNQMIQAVRTGMGQSGGIASLITTGIGAGMGYFTGGGMEASAAMGAGTYSGGLDSEYLGGHTTGRGAWAKGGVSINGNPTYLAKGGYVNSIVKKPTYVANGTIAGESGSEGVLPLQRDSQGRLGVINAGGSGETKNITVNIVNESGEKVEVTKSEAKTDMSGMVLDIWIDAMTRNKRGIRDMVRG